MIKVQTPEVPKRALNPVEAMFALVFHSDGSSQYVTQHKVTKNGFARGSLVSPSTIKNLTNNLFDSKESQKADLNFTPDNVLLDSDEYLVWQKNAFLGNMWFASSSNISSVKIHYPNLVFAVHKRSKRLHVAAIATTSRAKPSTKVYQAPIWNLSARGGFCLGNAKMPKTIDVSTIPMCEDAVINSQFTHPNCDHLIKGVKSNKEYIDYLKSKESTKGKFRASELYQMTGVKTVGEWLTKVGVM